MRRSNSRVKPAGIVLTGGASRRMGRDKAMLPLPDGRAMGVAIAELLNGVCAPVLLVDPEPARFAGLGFQAVADAANHSGPLAGLVAGLRATHTSHVFLAGCDTPFLIPALVPFLLERIGDNDALVAKVGGRLQPLAALYSKSILRIAQELLAQGPLGLQRLLACARVDTIPEEDLREIDPTLSSFRDLDTPAEFSASFPADEP